MNHNKCPKCGAKQFPAAEGFVSWFCTSAYNLHTGYFDEGRTCLRRQLKKANRQLKLTQNFIKRLPKLDVICPSLISAKGKFL